MRQFFASVCIAVLGPALAAGAQEPGSVLASLIQAERNFADTSVEKGIRPAFLEYLAEDAVLFRPGPVPGRKWMEDNPPDPGALSWEPSYAEVSRAGDVGFTTGPYEYRGAGENPRIGYGHFVTVWKKQADQAWKVAIDFGTPHAKPDHPESLTFRPGNGAKAEQATANVAEELQRLLRTDQSFATAARQGVVEAYRQHVDSDILFLRFRQNPVAGRSAVLEALAGFPGELSWKPENGGVSGSGDLGYVYGSARFQSSKSHVPALTGHYLRVWRRVPRGEWRVALDLMMLAPPDN